MILGRHKQAILPPQTEAGPSCLKSSPSLAALYLSVHTLVQFKCFWGKTGPLSSSDPNQVLLWAALPQKFMGLLHTEEPEVTAKSL